MVPYLLIWLALTNFIAFVAMGVDKRRSKSKGKRRLPEKSIFIIAAIGGGAGVLGAMLLFRHKTRHWYFVAFIPLILAAECVLLWLAWPTL